MTTDTDLEELRAAYELLRAENTRLRDELAYKSRFDAQAELRELRAAIARVEALCHWQHSDRLIRVGDILAALQGKS